MIKLLAKHVTLFRIMSAAFVISMGSLSTAFVLFEGGKVVEDQIIWQLTTIEIGSDSICFWGIIGLVSLFVTCIGILYKQRLLSRIGALMCIVVWAYAFSICITYGYYIEALTLPLLHICYWSIAYWKSGALDNRTTLG